jgi:hypothetical protein
MMSFTILFVVSHCLPGPDSVPAFNKPVNWSTDRFMYVPLMYSTLLFFDNFDAASVSCHLASLKTVVRQFSFMFLDPGDPVPIEKSNVTVENASVAQAT